MRYGKKLLTDEALLMGPFVAKPGFMNFIRVSVTDADRVIADGPEIVIL